MSDTTTTRKAIPRKQQTFEDTIEGALRSLVGEANQRATSEETFVADVHLKQLRQFLRSIKGLQNKKIDALIAAGFESIEDLVFHYPTRYLDARQLVPLRDVRKHLMKPVSIRAQVLTSQLIPGRMRSRAAIVLKDDSGGVLQLVYFDFPEWRVKSFVPGQEYLVAGYVGMYRNVLQIVQPPFIEQISTPEDFAEGKMLPLYSLPMTLRKAGLREKQFREIIHKSVDRAEELGLLTEILPIPLVEHGNMMRRTDAIREVHQPESPERLDKARWRLKYEEVFFLQLRLAVERMRMRKAIKGVVRMDVSRLQRVLAGQPLLDAGPAEQVLAALPWKLTADQERSLQEFLTDMSKAGGRSYPMNRLLQGDVGSGKTIVALLAMLVAVENGYQCAFMAPTEVLAAQHYDTLSKLLKNTYVQTSLLMGGQGKGLRKGILEAIAAGETHIVVGTHALIEKGVKFQRLGFVVTDEQHRFGVAQRRALIEKSFDQPEADIDTNDMFRSRSIAHPVSPDVLIMTATPIPRTLALTLYGDMDVSTIRQMPKGRKPIKTMLFFEHDLPKVYEAAKRRIRQKGEQVFIVYPLREKSEKVDSEAAEKGFEQLQSNDFKEFKVGLIHGKMSSDQKQEAMRKFREREFDVLVATTVIEVGVDIPNATVMIVQHADRFGLAQLHQLRGRVGRGSADSACVLVASQKLATADERTSLEERGSAFETSDQLEQASLALERLKTLVAISDGFELAKADLAFRGSGEVLGLKQSGKVILKIANLATDVEIVQQTLLDAEALLNEDPQLRTPANQETRTEFLRLYRDAESYLHVG